MTLSGNPTEIFPKKGPTRIHESKEELDTIESSVERLRMKQESPEGVNGAARSEN